MSISSQQLELALQIVSAATDVRAAAALLRQQLAPLRALVLDPFDMRGEQPAARVAQRAIYLMATDGHCWSVTSDPQAAAALALTQS